jgi:hypothetical protein
MIGRLPAAAFILLALITPARGDDVVTPQVAAVAAQMDPRVAQTLVRLDGTGKQLLALRSYVRSAAHLAERWSWTQEQIAAFEGSPEQLNLRHEIDQVSKAFTRNNPGFELYVNPQVRSLGTQIAHWNSNESVTAAAVEILAAARALIASPGFPADRPERAREVFRAFLSDHTPMPAPTIAAPGLSLHGQMRAIDFHVYRNGRGVAGPSTSAIATDWEAAGWAARLNAAIQAAGNRFVGPLASSSAPWHYIYVPEAVAGP